MRRMLATLLSFALLVGVVASSAAPVGRAAWIAPPAPTLVDRNPYGNEGDWLIGATPPNFDPSKPVLVFVQGLNGSAQSWWGPTRYYGDNDMYAYAYNYGYRTAFVQFRDADGNAASMWRNGAVLRQLLAEITDYFGVNKVDVVAHSKGGVDTQAAIVHYGAYPYVRRVLTLASPHRGSQLADLAYSWWAWWLAALLGQTSDGTYVMQTGYMSYFRSVTDGRAEDIPMDNYRTLAGSDWGPWLSAMWWGGSYLSYWGSNDGVVTVASAHGLPGRKVTTTSSAWNHDNIRMGRQVFSYVQEMTSTPAVADTVFEFRKVARVASASASTGRAELTTAPLNSIYRGGRIEPGAAGVERVPIEPGVNVLRLEALFSAAPATARWTSPSGEVYELTVGQGGAEIFSNAYRAGVSITNPEPGIWTFAAESRAENGYLLNLALQGGLGAQLEIGANLRLPGDALDWTIDLTSGGQRVKDASAFGRVLRVEPANTRVLADGAFEVPGSDSGRIRLARLLPREDGIYNLSLTITGTLVDGSPFERSFVTSLAVADPARRGRAQLEGWTDR